MISLSRIYPGRRSFRFLFAKVIDLLYLYEVVISLHLNLPDHHCLDVNRQEYIRP